MPIATLRPDANFTAPETWAGCASANYTCVNDASDATWVASSTVDEVEMYEFDDMPVTTTAINSVTVKFRGQGRDSVGNQMAPYWQVNGNAKQGSVVTLTMGSIIEYTETSIENPNNPGDTSIWTIDEVNNIKMGQVMKKIIASGSGRQHDIWLEVDYETGGMHRYHELSGMGGQGTMTKNPMD